MSSTARVRVQGDSLEMQGSAFTVDIYECENDMYCSQQMNAILNIYKYTLLGCAAKPHIKSVLHVAPCLRHSSERDGVVGNEGGGFVGLPAGRVEHVIAPPEPARKSIR